jgi:hypothetical protein
MVTSRRVTAAAARATSAHSPAPMAASRSTSAALRFLARPSVPSRYCEPPSLNVFSSRVSALTSAATRASVALQEGH